MREIVAFKERVNILKHFKYLCVILIALLASVQVCAAKTSPYDERELVKKLVKEVGALDENIIAVRPGREKELTLGGFNIQWMPAVTIKRGTKLSRQEAIAKKLARYIVDFQGGVPTKDVHGGMIAFIEGKGWYPKLHTVSYKVTKRKPLTIEVWTGYQKPNKHGTATCCTPGKQIGTIKNDKFVLR